MLRALRLALVPLAAGLLLVGGGAARAQLTVSPESLRVALAGGREAATLTLTNASGSALRYCLDFDRPLRRRGDDLPGASTCGAPGALLDTVTDRETGVYWAPHALAMTPDGRLFAAENGPDRTFELDAALNVLRSFVHPTVAELSPFPRTVGVTYNEHTGTLWWTNAEVYDIEVRRILLLEGTLDGVATGRRIELPVPPGLPPDDTGFPMGATYDPATKLFYYVDGLRDDLWAADTTGAVQAGYPVRLAAYPEAVLGSGLDVHGGSAVGGAGGDPAGVRLEVPAGLGFDLTFDRVVVTDAQGGDLGAETPLPPLSELGGLWGGYPEGNALRSRVDPNGVLYVAYAGYDPDTLDPVVHGIAALRPVPLAPPWLGLSAWSGVVDAGGRAEVGLRFGAGDRAPGVYRTVLVVEDTTGAVLVQVPLALEVLPDLAGEPGPGGPPAVSLSVVPNPSWGEAEVALALAAPGAVRLAVYDVLGREVAVLHDGALGAGAHAFAFDGAGLPPGLYVVRAAAGGAVATHTLTRLR